MTLLMNREGNLSVFRVGVLLAVLGVLGIGAGFVFWNMEHAARQSPLNVELYPGAAEYSREEAEGRSRRTIYYQTNAPTEDVVAYYQAELDDFTNSDPRDPDREQCVRQPREGNFENFEPGTGLLPYYYDCAFDNSYLDSTQVTFVRIQPGVRLDSDDPAQAYDQEGLTFIIYDQDWAD